MKFAVSMISLCSLLMLVPACGPKQGCNGCYSSCSTTYAETQPVSPASEVVLGTQALAPIEVEVEEEEDFEEFEEPKSDAQQQAPAAKAASLKEDLDEDELDEIMDND